MSMTNTMDEVPRLLLRIEEAARMCGLSRSKLYELIGSGRIECVRIGRSRRIPIEAVKSFVASLRSDEGGVG